MIGELVPAVIMPRFTSYVGPGTYATVPLDVTEFPGGLVTFWRGPLVGGAASTPFQAIFEESQDAQVWRSTSPGTVTTVNRSDPYAVLFGQRWFRVRVVLAADANGVVALSMWLSGAFERRVP